MNEELEGRGVTYDAAEVQKYLDLAVGDTRMTSVLANEVDRLREVLSKEIIEHYDTNAERDALRIEKLHHEKYCSKPPSLALVERMRGKPSHSGPKEG